MKISKRHIAKSLTWRFIGTMDTFVFACIITGDLKQGINISGLTIITKLIWYYIHERIWFKYSVLNSNKRHIFKTLTWRFIGTLDTLVFGWLITGNPFTGLKIGGIETVSKILLYFGHEKIWYRINFGLDKRNRFKRSKMIED